MVANRHAAGVEKPCDPLVTAIHPVAFRLSFVEPGELLAIDWPARICECLERERRSEFGYYGSVRMADIHGSVVFLLRFRRAQSVDSLGVRRPSRQSVN